MNYFKIIEYLDIDLLTLKILLANTMRERGMDDGSNYKDHDDDDLIYFSTFCSCMKRGEDRLAYPLYYNYFISYIIRIRIKLKTKKKKEELLTALLALSDSTHYKLY